MQINESNKVVVEKTDKLIFSVLSGESTFRLFADKDSQNHLVINGERFNFTEEFDGPFGIKIMGGGFASDSMVVVENFENIAKLHVLRYPNHYMPKHFGFSAMLVNDTRIDVMDDEGRTFIYKRPDRGQPFDLDEVLSNKNLQVH